MLKPCVFLTLVLLSGNVAYSLDYDRACDTNQDGVIDEQDIFRIQRHWHGVEPTPTATPVKEITIELPDLPVEAVPLILIRIPAGSFIMGSSDDATWSWCNPCEQPVHEVGIGYDFFLGKHEITQAQWLAVMNSNPAYFSACGGDCPVETVSWNDCQAFVTALNLLVPGGGFRLPSEAEWEYACLAGTTTRFSFGDSRCNANDCNSCKLSDYAWWCGNNGASGTPEYGTKIVGQKLPNPFGLHDMHGNVFEWCQDLWHDDYTDAPSDGSAWETGESTHQVVRGGDWSCTARDCRSACRGREYAVGKGGWLGFRVARDAP